MNDLAARDRPVVGVSSRSTRAFVIALLALVTFLVLFLLRAAAQSGDSLAYATSARVGERMFHPHHLLYIPAIRGFYLVLGAICSGCDVILAAQIHNIFWASAVVVAIFFMVEKISGSTMLAGAFGLLFLSLQGFGYYTTQVEVYVPSTACLTLVVALLLHQEDDRLRLGPQVIAGFLLATAIFYHQTSILFCLPLVAYLVHRYGTHGWRHAIVVVGLAAVVVLIGYVAAFVGLEAGSSLAGFIDFCLSYAVVINPGWGTMDNVSLRGIRELAYSQLWNVVALPVAVPAFMKIVIPLAIGALAWQGWAVLRRRSFASLRLCMLVWVVVTYGFFLWWLPSEREFFVTPLVPLVLLTVLTIRDIATARTGGRVGRRSATAIVVVAGVCFALNSPTAYAMHRSRGDAYDVARAMDRVVPAEGYVMLADFYTRKHLEYYFDRPGTLAERGPGFQFYRRDLARPTAPYDVLEQCGASMRLAVLHPGCGYDDYDGNHNPVQWLRFVRWLFAYAEDSIDGPFTCRDFELKQDDRGDVFVLLHATRQPIDGMLGLFEMLDEQAGRIASAGTPAFVAWWARHAGPDAMSRGALNR